jgi:methane monooxygenase component A alpha chain
MTQMLDEIRHTNVEAYLIRYLAKHAYDPAGFNSSLQTRVYDPICLAGRAAFETFLNDDPITCAINLQVITETAYTNPLFVATTEISAANNDPATPSVFLSVQSDEARHMANGYATLAAVLSDSDNLPLLQHDLDASFWRQHMFLDDFLGAIYDYFPTIRLLSYAEYWDRWVWDDWVGSYLERLAPFGLRPPRWIEKARKNVRWGGHTTAMFSASTWPLHPWRSDRMLEADFGYLEDHYPGWHKRFGPFWEAYDAMSDPLEGVLPFDLLGTAAVMCRVCQLPAIYPLPELADPKYLIDASDRRHALCSEACEEIFLSAPHRYQAMTWQELYGGMALSEYIVKAGLVRPDGKTLVGQPHLHTDEKRLWTIDDIRRADVELRDPLLDVALEAFRRIG